MSTFSKRVSYQFSRVRNFLKVFTRKTTGVLGLIIIVFFMIVALGSSLLTPYDPIRTIELSSARAAPTWLRHVPSYLGGNPALSENVYVVKDLTFSSASSLEEWSVSVNSTNFGALEYDPNFGYSKNGCAHVSYTRGAGGLTGNNTFVFFKKFNFPYSGPPGSFAGRVALFINGSGTERVVIRSIVDPTTGEAKAVNMTVKFLDVPVKIELFLGHVDDTNWTVWPITGQEPPELVNRVALEDTGKWYASEKFGALITGNTGLNEMFRALTNKDALQTIFWNKNLPADYFFGLRLTFLDSDVYANKTVTTDAYIDDTIIDLMGTSFGLLGTDQHGRDLFTQLVYGARLSLYVGLLSSFISVFLGLIVGLIAGYLGRIVDEFLMRFTDMLLVIPMLPLLIVISAVLGTSLENLILIIGFLGWMSFARLVRSQVLSLKERPFIEAAKAAGAGRIHILTTHIMPNVASLIYVSLATAVPSAIVTEAALAFLGFTDPWRVSWGKMLSDVQEAAAWANWWWVVPPGLAIALLAMAFIFLGFALDEVLNPKLRIRR